MMSGACLSDTSIPKEVPVPSSCVIVQVMFVAVVGEIHAFCEGAALLHI